MNIILGDYVRTILNLNQSHSTWTLDPRIEFDEPFAPEAVPTATGNQVSVEFNLVYRWHSAISQRDSEWAEGLYKEVFPGQDPATLSLPQLSKGLQAWAASIDSDPGKRTFGNLERTKTGAFEDAALVELLRESTEDVAGELQRPPYPADRLLSHVCGLMRNIRRFWSSQCPYCHESN